MAKVDESIGLGFDNARLRALRAELEASYSAAHPRSGALYERALKVMPGGNTRYQVFFPPYPFYVARAEGARLFDVDGFDYIDLVSNYTSMIHGHAHPAITGTLREQISQSTAFGAPSPLEVELAEELCARLPSLETVRFANSGTEAVYYAIRSARAFTGRDDVIKVEGGYSGGVDVVQVSVKKIGRDPTDAVVEYGVPGVQAQHTHIIPFNDTEAALAKIRAVGHRCACLVIEPIQGSAGTLPADRDYLQALRDITTEMGIVLLFDEVLCLRVAYGGAQELFGITPDLTAMGKIVGGGLPVGAFGGRADVMAVNDPRRDEYVLHAGTFNANPVTLAAGLSSMRLLTRERIAQINAHGDHLRARLNALAGAKGVPVAASGIGSLLQVHTGSTPPRSFREASARPTLAQGTMFYAMLAAGTFAAPGRCLMNVSTAISESDVAEIEGAIDSSLDQLRDTVER